MERLQARLRQVRRERRERIATAALAAIAGNGEPQNQPDTRARTAATCVQMADALMAALDDEGKTSA